ncbi:unnamed protein product [Amoebophrya sp. A120]|nr:unnamed protein product [Amoebophrya sp. A120]|eukprot:GSA120T00013903001.1
MLTGIGTGGKILFTQKIFEASGHDLDDGPPDRAASRSRQQGPAQVQDREVSSSSTAVSYAEKIVQNVQENFCRHVTDIPSFDREPQFTSKWEECRADMYNNIKDFYSGSATSTEDVEQEPLRPSPSSLLNPCTAQKKSNDYHLALYEDFHLSDRAVDMESDEGQSFFWRFVTRKFRPHHGPGILFNSTHWIQLQKHNRWSKPPNERIGWWGCKPTLRNLTIDDETGDLLVPDETLEDAGPRQVSEDKFAPTIKNERRETTDQSEEELEVTTEAGARSRQTPPQTFLQQNKQHSNCVVNLIREFPFAFGHFLSDLLPAILWTMESLARILVKVNVKEVRSDEVVADHPNMSTTQENLKIEFRILDEGKPNSRIFSKKASPNGEDHNHYYGGTFEEDSQEASRAEPDVKVENILENFSGLEKLVRENFHLFRRQRAFLDDERRRKRSENNGNKRKQDGTSKAEEKTSNFEFPLLQMCNTFVVPWNHLARTVYELLRQNLKMMWSVAIKGTTSSSTSSQEPASSSPTVVDSPIHRLFHGVYDTNEAITHSLLLSHSGSSISSSSHKNSVENSFQKILQNILHSNIKLIPWEGPMVAFYAKYWIIAAPSYCENIAPTYNAEVMTPHGSKLISKYLSYFTSSNPFDTASMPHQSRRTATTSRSAARPKMLPGEAEAQARRPNEMQIQANHGGGAQQHVDQQHKPSLNVVLIQREGSVETMKKKEYAWHFPYTFLVRSWVEHRIFVRLVELYNRGIARRSDRLQECQLEEEDIFDIYSAGEEDESVQEQMQDEETQLHVDQTVAARDDDVTESTLLASTSTSTREKIINTHFEAAFELCQKLLATLVKLNTDETASNEDSSVGTRATPVFGSTTPPRSDSQDAEEAEFFLENKNDSVEEPSESSSTRAQLTTGRDSDSATTQPGTPVATTLSPEINQEKNAMYFKPINLVIQNFTNIGLRESIDRFAHAEVAIYPFGSASSNAAFMRRWGGISRPPERAGITAKANSNLHPSTRTLPLCVEFVASETSMPARGKNEIVNALGFEYLPLAYNESYTHRPIFLDPLRVFAAIRSRLVY